jgi:isopropylmalate/homocitrate/citramalate synthase
MLGFTLPPAQEVAISLYQMLGMDIGIKWEKTREVCQLVAERAKTPISPARPFIGTRLGYGQVGISDHAAFERYEEMEKLIQAGKPVPPMPQRRGMAALLGITRHKTIGKQSGRWSMNLKAWCMGLPLVDREQAAVLLEKVELKQINDKSYSVSDEDFIKFYEEATGKPAPPPSERKIPEVVKRGLGPVWA